jgi:hypothetical protein
MSQYWSTQAIYFTNSNKKVLRPSFYLEKYIISEQDPEKSEEIVRSLTEDCDSFKVIGGGANKVVEIKIRVRY